MARVLPSCCKWDTLSRLVKKCHVIFATAVGDTIVMKASALSARFCGACSQQMLHIGGVIHSKMCNLLL